jgi:hypothetical protein
LSVVAEAFPYGWWPLDEPLGSDVAASIAGDGAPDLISVSGVTFGVAGAVGLWDTEVQVLNATLSTYTGFIAPPFGGITATSHQFWGVWITPNETVGPYRLRLNYTTSPFAVAATIGYSLGAPFYTNSGSPQGAQTPANVPHHYGVQVYQETITGTSYLRMIPYFDGVAMAGVQTLSSYVGAAATATEMTPVSVELIAAHATGAALFSNLTGTPTWTEQYSAVFGTTEAEHLEAIANVVPEITLDTLPADLSTAPLGYPNLNGVSALDAFNEIILTEQGAIYSATSGTLTAPVEVVKVRTRDRVEDVDYTFNVETEASGGTDFIRDITNMVQTATVDGPETSATYTDTTLTARVGSKNTSETLPLRDYVDLFTWATDRVVRGANVNLRAASLTIDALTTPTDRSADLLALIPGDRIQATGLPSSLGFTTWDGWLLGVEETHSLTEHSFTLYLQPVLPDPIILDTDLLTAGDAVTLTSNINNSVTSISLTSTGGLWTTGADLPQVIRIGTECMTLSAVSGASSPQTGTVTRGATDPITGLVTTAAAQVAGETVELAEYGVLAF